MVGELLQGGIEDVVAMQVAWARMDRAVGVHRLHSAYGIWSEMTFTEDSHTRALESPSQSA